MSIIANITVGNTTFYEVDDFPTHIGVVGDVSIHKDLGRVYINTDGGTTWLKSIPKSYGEMHFSDNTLTKNTTIGSWTNYDSINWTLGLSNGWSMPFNGRLQYDGDKIIKIITKFTTTVQANTSRWLDFEASQSFNNTIPLIYQGSTAIDNSNRVAIASNRVETVTNSQFFQGAVRWVDSESSGSAIYIPRHSTLTVMQIDEADSIFNEDWESNSFIDNSWVVVNDTTNQWVIGIAENNTFNGSRAAYISNNGGSSATYNVNTANVSHVYRDFIIPGGTSNVALTFDWKSWGENAGGTTQYDYGAVVITDKTTTPLSGIEVQTSQAPTDSLGNPTGNGRIGANTNLGKFNHGYGGTDNTWRNEVIDLSNFIGETKRIVFTWSNDSSVGNTPPFVIDNIKLQVF